MFVSPVFQPFTKPFPSVGAAAFSPLDIAGLVGWWDFSDLTTLYQDDAGTTPVAADGDVIGKILDKSTLSNHMKQSVTASKSIYKIGIQNGLSSGLFTVDDYYTSALATSSTAYTVFIIAKSTNAATANLYFLNGNGSDGYLFGIISSSRIILNNNVDLLFDGSATTNTELWTVKRSGSTTSMKVNDSSVSLTNSTASVLTPTTQSQIGSPTSSLIGYLQEILLFDNALSAEDEAGVVGYLNEKWVVY